MLGYLDRKKHKRKKKSFGGSLYIPKSEKSTFVMPPLENQERRDFMVDTVNHMLSGNVGVGTRNRDSEPPKPSRLNLPLQPPSIPQMPLGASSSSGGAPIADRPETETDVQFVWTGKPMIEGVKRTGRILRKGLSMGAQGSLMAGDLALRGIETGMDAGQMVLDGVQTAIDVADYVRGFTRSRQQGSIEYEEGPRAIADGNPEAINDVSDVEDEPEVVGDFVDLT